MATTFISVEILCNGMFSCRIGHSHRKAPPLIMAEKREFSGKLVPLELRETFFSFIFKITNDLHNVDG